MPFVDAGEVLLEDELLARRQQEGALVALVPQVAIGQDQLVAVPALAEVARILAAVLDHPLDEVGRAGRRRRVPVVGDGTAARAGSPNEPAAKTLPAPSTKLRLVSGVVGPSERATCDFMIAAIDLPIAPVLWHRAGGLHNASDRFGELAPPWQSAVVRDD